MSIQSFTKSVVFSLFGLSCYSIHAGEMVGEVTLRNSSSNPRLEEPVTLSLKSIGLTDCAIKNGCYFIKSGDEQIPMQVIDSNGDGEKDAILFLTSLEGSGQKHFTIYQRQHGMDVPVGEKRTQADLSHKVNGEWVQGKAAGNKERGDWEYTGGEWTDVISLHVPDKHSDHANFIRYEGIGLESDKVGYRFYLDWRNGFDIWGKTSPGMMLKKAGLDGFESYHHLQDWGMDVLKVGDALGIGGYGFWDGEKVLRVSDWSQISAKVLENGHLQSSIQISYKDWTFLDKKLDLRAVISMQAGSHLARVQLTTSDDIDGICAGLVKHGGTELLKGDLDITGEAWSYLATWGKQSLDEGDLGMAILFRKNSLREITEDPINDVVVLRSADRNYEYYFLATWDKEPGAITTREAFESYLVDQVDRLTVPSRVRKSNRVGDREKTYPVTSAQAMKWSERLADTQLKRWGDHLMNGHFDKDIRNVARWSYTTGLMCQAYSDLSIATDDPKYGDQAFKIIDSFVDDEGQISGYRLENYNIDQVNSGKMLLRLYDQTGMEKFRKAADTLREQLRGHPRTSEGGFWHKKIYPWQLWLDGVYMGMPFLAGWEEMFNEGKGISEAVHEFVLVREHCKDPKTGLYYHAWDEKAEQSWANPETGCSEHFWGRGFGWYCMAMVDILDFIPENQKTERDTLIQIILEVADTLLQFQDPESGVWWQILDAKDRAGNYLESSASSMFTYFLAKALNNGYISGEKYMEATRRAYDGLVREFVEIDADGDVRLTDTCRVAGLGYGRDGTYHYYMSEPVVTDDPKGVGPFIMAGIEVSKLLK